MKDVNRSVQKVFPAPNLRGGCGGMKEKTFTGARTAGRGRPSGLGGFLEALPVTESPLRPGPKANRFGANSRSLVGGELHRLWQSRRAGPENCRINCFRSVVIPRVDRRNSAEKMVDAFTIFRASKCVSAERLVARFFQARASPPAASRRSHRRSTLWADEPGRCHRD